MTKSVIDALRVAPGKKFELAKVDTMAHFFDHGDKDANLELLRHLGGQLDTLQECLYANRHHRLLVVLQGMDTSGKDGTVRAVFNSVNPVGIRVAAFKVPTDDEKAHGFMWRIQAQTPRVGETVIFNRSHYEDILITHVHGWIDDDERERRVRIINEFERGLAEEGTLIIKCMLHISSDEQKRRLEARIADPNKHWKFSPGDLIERRQWDRYMQAYEYAINHTSTDIAPWWVIPSDSKTQRNLAVATLIVEQLQSLNLKYPPPVPDYFKIKIT